MAKIWSSLFRGGDSGDEKRMTIDDWAEQYFTYKGLGYPISGGPGVGNGSEAIGSDFEGYVAGAFKSNGIVFACMVARQFVFSEARFQFQPFKRGRPGDLYGSPELAVLEHPWPNGTTGELLSRAIQDADLSGNHYAVREGNRIRRLRPDWVEIILTAPPDQAVESDVAGYLYRPGGTQNKELWKFYPIGDTRFAHWSPIPDPEAQYRGMSWLTPVIRDVMADKAAALHKSKFFENGASPAMAVSFKETVTAAQFKEFMEQMDAAHTGVENAYSTLYLGGGADVTPLTHNLQQLDFKGTVGTGETRIAAAARIHPVIVGLSEGLSGSSLNAGNFKAAKDAFADQTLRPLWRSICAAYEALIRVPVDSRLWYDGRDIAFLQDDVEQIAKIQAMETASLSKLIMQGYTPESAVLAITKKDLTLLTHTGLYSVQLQPPMPDGPPEPPSAAAPAKPATPPKKPAAPAAAKTPPKPAAKPAA